MRLAARWRDVGITVVAEARHYKPRRFASTQGLGKAAARTVPSSVSAVPERAWLVPCWTRRWARVQRQTVILRGSPQLVRPLTARPGRG